jgi:hypothetical protein
MAQQLQGTFDEALRFLTNPVTGETSWTCIRALHGACQQMTGTPSLGYIVGTEKGQDVLMTLQVISRQGPIPDGYKGDWEDWLNAFLSQGSDEESRAFEHALSSRA